MPYVCWGGGLEGGDVVEGGGFGVVTQFSYLGDVLDSEGWAQRAVRARVAAVWGKWREISGLLLNKGIPLARRGIRSAMLYEGETWVLTKRLEGVLIGCDRRMLRYMAGVTRQDWVSCEEVARRCGVGMLGDALLRRRLGWFGIGGMSGMRWEGFGWLRFLVIDRRANQRKHGRKIRRRS